MTLANAADLFLPEATSFGREAIETPLILTAPTATAPPRPTWTPQNTADRTKLAETDRVATALARKVFGARHADVSPRSSDAALAHVLSRLAEPGDTVLDLWLAGGSHFGSADRGAVRWISYGVDEADRVDYDGASALAAEFRPSVLVCGSSSYPRHLDFARLRQIADECGAYLVADISAVTGLVAAQLYPNPVGDAHVTIAATDDHLDGDGGGLVLCGEDGTRPFGGNGRTLSQRLGKVGKSVPPDGSGLPELTAKAGALAMAGSAWFRTVGLAMLENARTLAETLSARGYRLVSGGTDTHLVLLDLTPLGLTGGPAERALTAAGIPVTRTRVPADPAHPDAAGGLLLASSLLTQRGCSPAEFRRIGELVHAVLDSMRHGGQFADAAVLADVRAEATALARRFAPPR